MGNPLLGPLLLQLCLIGLNAFFACTEIAVISLNDTKLKMKADSGDKRARILMRLTGQPARFLATIQVGITLAGFLASAFAADNFSDRLVSWLLSLGAPLSEATLNTLAVVVITLVLSYFTLVLGELVPKRIAMQKAESIAMAVSRIIDLFSRIASPLIGLLTVSTNGILRLLKMNVHAQEDSVTEEEIRIMVDLGEEKGEIAHEEGEMIDNVLELGDRTAAELMTHRTALTVLWMEDGIEAWERTLCSTGHSRYPVCGDDMDDIVGVLHVRDFLCTRRDPDLSPADLLRPAYLVPETVRADVLMRDMRQKRIHLAVVIDEWGGTSGVVTLEDLLEAIVGPIDDEYDVVETDGIVDLGGGRWRVRGSVSMETLARELGIGFPQGDYDTLGGLIFAQLSSIPAGGGPVTVDVAGVRIRVTDWSDRRVEWAEITKPEPAGGDSR